MAPSITATTYTKTGLTAGVSYQFKVQSHNSYGLSAQSTALAVVASSVPDTPLNFANIASLTTASQIGLNWTPGLSDGGSTLLDY